MRRQHVVERLKAIEPQFRAQGVAALYLYGSYARDEADDDSDIDILVDFAPDRGANFTDYMAPYETLEKAFPNVTIGYGGRDGLAPAYRPFIEQSAIRLF